MEMKKMLTLLLIVIASFLVFSGCSENSRGTFGPAWDVALQAPAIKQSNALAELLDTKEFKEFGYKINADSTISLILVGAKENEIKKETEINLKPITLNSVLVNLSADGAAENGEFSKVILDPIPFDKFDSITLSSKNLSINKFNVFLNNTNKESIENKLDNLTIELQNSQGTVISSVTFENVAVGTTKSLEMDLAQKTLESGMKLAVKGIQSSGTTTFTVDITSSSLEISKVKGLHASELNSMDTLNFTPSLNFGSNTAITGSEGAHLRLNTLFPVDSNLDFEISNFTLGGVTITDTNGDGYYDLPADTNISDELFISGKLNKTASTVNYDSTQSVTLDTAIYGSLIINLPPEDADNLKVEDSNLVYEEISSFDISNDDIDRINDGLKEGRLVTKTVNNLGSNVIISIDLYVGNSPTFDNTYVFIDKIVDIPLGEATKEFVFNQEVLNKFKDKSYLAMKVKVGNGTDTASFTPDQEISIESYGVLVLKVNQNKE
jgi:hypothetical protein